MSEAVTLALAVAGLVGLLWWWLWPRQVAGGTKINAVAGVRG